jgi:hypothetical protein
MSYTPCFNEEDGLGINEKDGFWKYKKETDKRSVWSMWPIWLLYVIKKKINKDIYDNKALFEGSSLSD